MRISDWSSDVCSSDLDDVGGVLEADRKAQQAVADAECGAILRLQTLVRRRRRMGDEALGVAEIVGDVDKAKRVHHAKSARLSAGDLEGHQREIGRAHVRTQVTNAHLVCSILLAQNKYSNIKLQMYTYSS